ncbi:hypothetical protein EV424DRAFT_1534974 [Suillus variegatus]|nr:hypothetical protein EV424DRAFT_1534974 [Suillus variegatus]
MPKCSSKVRSALENLGQYAKKRKVSAQADKENKCPTVDTTIFVSASPHEYRPLADIQLSVVTKETLDIPMEDQSDSSSESDSDLDRDHDLNSDCNEIEHGPSEGYEMFESTRNYDNPRVSSVPRASPGEKDSSIFPWHSFDACTPPSLDSARLALCDLRNLLHPPRDKGHRPKVTGLTSILKKRLSWMEYFLHAFIQGAAWSAAALKTVQFAGKGPYMSRKVREWSKAYIQDRKNLLLQQRYMSPLATMPSATCTATDDTQGLTCPW